MESLYQQYKDRGLIIISIYAENNQSQVPSQSDLAGWANTYGLTTPVVADPGWQVFDSFWPGGSTPSNALLEPGMRVYTTNWVTLQDIEAVVPD